MALARTIRGTPAHPKPASPCPLSAQKACAKRFSVRTKTPMESSKLGFQTWAIALYQVTTNLKGVSSMKLHRDLGITQRSAWFLAHRLREAWKDNGPQFSGPVEVDEAYMGGRKKNMSKAKRREAFGRGPAGKPMVMGAKDRETNAVVAKVVSRKDRETMQGFVAGHVAPGAKVYTDTAGGYSGMTGFDHERVNHNVGEYVRGKAHTNGVDRVVLVHVEACAQGHLPQDQRKAPRPLRHRVRGAAQRPRSRYHRYDGPCGSGNGGEAVALFRLDLAIRRIAKEVFRQQYGGSKYVDRSCSKQ